MNSGKTIFSRQMDFIPTYKFRKCVERYDGNHKIKSFSSWDQLISRVLKGHSSIRPHKLLADSFSNFVILHIFGVDPPRIWNRYPWCTIRPNLKERSEFEAIFT
jgi:hypothetical protein